jgi:DNA topoisomerase-6 subunit B
LHDDFDLQFVEDMDPRELDVSKIRKLVDKIQQHEFDKPSGAELSPAGEYNLHLGIMKEMRPDMIATNTAEVQEVGGHPVLVEAAVSLGGRRAKEGITVHRFANRIPMLFQPGADVSYKTANQRIPWKTYRMDKNNQKIGAHPPLRVPTSHCCAQRACSSLCAGTDRGRGK